ncbi:unnamed protein product [Diamesa tonsa]
MNCVKTIVAVVLLVCLGEVAANRGLPCAGIMNGFKNDYSDCERYFTCINEVEYPQRCPNGLFYDENSQTCDRPENVECLRCPATGYLIYRYTDSCSNYAFCENGVHTDFRCQMGSYFHEYVRSCFESQHVVCDICPYYGSVVVHDRSDCRKYNLCSSGQIIGSNYCDNDQFFDRNTKTCVSSPTCPPTSTSPIY